MPVIMRRHRGLARRYTRHACTPRKQLYISFRRFVPRANINSRRSCARIHRVSPSHGGPLSQVARTMTSVKVTLLEFYIVMRAICHRECVRRDDLFRRDKLFLSIRRGSCPFILNTRYILDDTCTRGTEFRQVESSLGSEQRCSSCA